MRAYPRPITWIGQRLTKDRLRLVVRPTGRLKSLTTAASGGGRRARWELVADADVTPLGSCSQVSPDLP